MNTEFSIVDPHDVPTESFNTCDVSHRKLTETLGCTEMRVNQVIVEPGGDTDRQSPRGACKITARSRQLIGYKWDTYLT